MRVSIFVLASGCNAIFGNDSVQPIPASDAQFFDAKLDAPPMCPSGTPTFRPDLYDVETTGTCASYSIAEDGTFVAACTTTEGKRVIESGSVVIGVPMSAALAVVPTDLPATAWAVTVRVAPEGDFAIARVFDAGDSIHALQLVAGTWHDLGVIPGFAAATAYSQPTRGPQRHVLEWNNAGLIEHVGDGLTWTTPGPLPTEGVQSINGDFGLTPDGLRLVINGTSKDDGLPRPRYAVRSDLAVPFTVSTQIDEPVTILQPFLTNDCDAVFFMGLERVLYVKQ